MKAGGALIIIISFIFSLLMQGSDIKNVQPMERIEPKRTDEPDANAGPGNHAECFAEHIFSS